MANPRRISLDQPAQFRDDLFMGLARLSYLIRLSRASFVMFARFTFALSAVLLAATGAWAQGVELRVYPESVTLDGPRAQQRLVVLARDSDGQVHDVSRHATLAVENPRVASVANGLVVPAGNGKTIVVVAAGKAKRTIPVTVTKATADIPVSFTREIVPILTKAGCNSGRVPRGAARPRRVPAEPVRLRPGLRPRADRAEQRGPPRRAVRPGAQHPAREAVARDGARRRRAAQARMAATTSRIRQWLEDGARHPSAKPTPKSRSIEVFPPARVMHPGEQQQLAVTATWTDGRSEDVTATAQFDALNDASPRVTPRRPGHREGRGRDARHDPLRRAGRRRAGHAALCEARQVPRLCRATTSSTRSSIAKWKDLGLTPSPLCADEEFLRRLYLDAIGTLPTPDEIRAFLADKSTEQASEGHRQGARSRPEFIDWWALKWGDLLRINRDRAAREGHVELPQLGARRGPRQQAGGRSSSATSSPPRAARSPKARRTSSRSAATPTTGPRRPAQLFLGVRMQCAKCHHHPFEKWSQDDYYGLAAFFARLGTKNSQEFGIFGRETVILPAQHRRGDAIRATRRWSSRTRSTATRSIVGR